jgi:hypothetical protein
MDHLCPRPFESRPSLCLSISLSHSNPSLISIISPKATKLSLLRRQDRSRAGLSDTRLSLVHPRCHTCFSPFGFAVGVLPHTQLANNRCFHMLLEGTYPPTWQLTSDNSMRMSNLWLTWTSGCRVASLKPQLPACDACWAPYKLQYYCTACWNTSVLGIGHLRILPCTNLHSSGASLRRRYPWFSLCSPKRSR